MTEFLPFLNDLVSYPFLRNALWASLLLAPAAGIIGTFVTVERINSMAGAVAHSVLAGLGAARYLQVKFGWEYPTPLQGAAAAAVLVALIVSAVTRRGRERSETVLAAIWAIGMAVGILFISATPGYSEDLMSYLFGNILMIKPSDTLLLGFLDLSLVLVIFLFYKDIFAVIFDKEFATIRGIKVDRIYLMMLLLTSLTIVLAVQVVGIVMVIALLTLPAATAGLFSTRLWKMMLFASLLSLVYSTGGLAISYSMDKPTGATIILFAAAVYLLTMLMKRKKA
ncbi:MAG TPA: metal ABC transporter permease [Sediminispirochaeta sp.]|nr:metal ABC transporter permease [Sediminispirochaeta sp.]